MTALQLIGNISGIILWLIIITLVVRSWQQRKGKRPPGREE